MSTEQEAFDEAFRQITESDLALDDVIEKLGAVGVQVEPWQRTIVSRWLDLFAADTPIPLAHRVSMLRGWLSESCPAP